MKKVLLIRIPPTTSFVDANTVVQWGKYTADGALLGDVHLTSVEQLKEAWLSDEPEGTEEDLLPDEIILLVGGSLCFYKRVPVNPGQKKHFVTALPYLIEEHLAQDIETMHIVSGFPDKELQVSVAAIPHSVLQAILSLFDEHQLPLTSIVAEMQLLVPESGHISLLLDSESVMMASPGGDTVFLSYEAIPFVFSEYSQQELPDTLVDSLEETVSDSRDKRPSQVRLLFSDNSLAVSASRVEEVSGMLSERGWLVDKQPLREAVFEFLAEQVFLFWGSSQLIDFRQGAYECPRRARQFFRRWWPLAAAVGCWLVLELGLSVMEGIVYQQQSESLWNDSIKSYLSVFPNDRQAQQAQARQQTSFNVKQVMENRFRVMDTQTAETPFLSMLQALSKISEEMGKGAGLEPRSLDFNNASGQLVYEFEVGELEVVNRFLERLNSTGFQSKLDNANQGKSSVVARVTIKK